MFEGRDFPINANFRPEAKIGELQLFDGPVNQLMSTKQIEVSEIEQLLSHSQGMFLF